MTDIEDHEREEFALIDVGEKPFDKPFAKTLKMPRQKRPYLVADLTDQTNGALGAS